MSDFAKGVLVGCATTVAGMLAGLVIIETKKQLDAQREKDAREAAEEAAAAAATVDDGVKALVKEGVEVVATAVEQTAEKASRKAKTSKDETAQPA